MITSFNKRIRPKLKNKKSKKPLIKPLSKKKLKTRKNLMRNSLRRTRKIKKLKLNYFKITRKKPSKKWKKKS